MTLEHDIQKEVVTFLRQWYSNKLYVFAVPNAGMRSLTCYKYYEQEGLTPGVADLVICYKNAKTLFIEMKDKKGKQRPSQELFEKEITKFGFKYFICRSLDDVLEVLKKEQVI